ncbi:MAG: YggS family pyridoxal phosphate-dependent enzyme [Actinobacteria bacterium]|nr:YggS family pyridoxal phosphate-dependent enzyme [Actinomycetota bacterium]
MIWVRKIRGNVESVIDRMRLASLRVGRNPEGTRLLLAVKNRQPGQIEEALSAGVRLVGENRVQEMLAKMEAVGGDVEWHFIGHLQRNKVKHVVGAVSLIHSVDSGRLALEVSRRAEQLGVVQPVLLQVNVTGEESKYGLEPEGVESMLESLADCGSIEVLGLSTIAPWVSNPEEVRWVFRDLRELGGRLEGAGAGFRCHELSMGMTEDFEVAIEEGSTIVRVGNAVFGPVD